ncbi:MULTISPECIES: molybdopterin molybdotransferase MoeA [unclassified Robiginitalea]|uniref:molybdopterin molybdotransferase MoeA n=1 Tax=Robiginitalea TaxID=252306 RepID=UPI00234BA223|nr:MULTISPECIES: molybdopterin molybdotransferase MoeA [unclassified Robiginitalea]MDC6354063.1 molybdopterin molybdotransferase MoeA [Robiginitalea sp. PM2]MDC6374330.1 molybdopterin molybdotransferase MoeA [Robiginitalea sp. SP8]
MISFGKAYEAVMAERWTLAAETVRLDDACGRYLAQPVVADRPLPPYDRATMDGIAICHRDFRDGHREYRIQGMARAGDPRHRLSGAGNCIEIATGAVLPEGADTVVRYEDLLSSAGAFTIQSDPSEGQSIHPAGSDADAGSVLLEPGTRIGPSEIAVLASVGVGKPKVYSLPAVTLVSTGDELVDVDQKPEPHQIRKSNTRALRAALTEFGIVPEEIHLADDPQTIRMELEKVLSEPGILLLSGGVSKGKFDYLPEVLEALGVRKCFHRVAQRPGKPFWFGVGAGGENLVFSFPGNPVSTFLSFHLYFRDWLLKSFGFDNIAQQARLIASAENTSGLTQFRLATVENREGTLWAAEVPMNSSGDFLSLARAEGFLCIEPTKSGYAKGATVKWIPFKFK